MVREVYGAVDESRCPLPPPHQPVSAIAGWGKAESLLVASFSALQTGRMIAIMNRISRECGKCFKLLNLEHISIPLELGL